MKMKMKVKVKIEMIMKMRSKTDNENEKVCHFFGGLVAVCAAGAHNFNPPFEIPDGTTHRGSQSLNGAG
jgi:DNA primase